MEAIEGGVFQPLLAERVREGGQEGLWRGVGGEE
jgi:hypothetical protein